MAVHFISPRILWVVEACRQIERRLPNPIHPRLKKAMWGILLTALFLLMFQTSAYGQRSLHPAGNQDEHILYVMIPPDVSREDIRYAKQPLKNRLLNLVKERQALELRFREEAVKLDRIVVFTDHNNLPILPDLDTARRRRNNAGSNRASRPATDELTFTFDSPTYPWTAKELDTLNLILSDFYPTARDVYGDPAFNITVNIRKDPTITFAGLYFPSLNEMVIRDGSNFDVVCHEMIHAFRDDNIIGLSSYEEGMTRAAEVEVFNRLAEYVHPFDENHSYTYDVYYEGLNRQKIGSRNGNFFQGYVSALLRYQLSGYAWAKAFLENTAFFRDFNRQLYDRTLVDPSATLTESTLLEIAAGIQSMVEGDTFLTWYGKQGVLNTNPPSDYFLYQRINQFTIDYFYRDGFGSESMQPNATVHWDVFDYQGTLMDSGSGVTSANGLLFFSPLIPSGYSGRIKVVANTLTPNGPVSDTALRSAGRAPGVFGIMAEDTSGTITIMSLDNPIPPVSLNVTQGAFYAPSLVSSKGKFLAVYTAPSGGNYFRQFTKDASDYFLYFAVALSAPIQFFTMNGGAGSVNVTAPANQSWSATSNESWITITSAGNFSGNGAASFQVEGNTTHSARKGTLTVAGQTLTVVQDGGLGEDCIYSISSTFESFPLMGGAGRVNVFSDERCAWQATTDDSWITITSGGVGIDDGTVTYSVAANTSATGRQGMINISGKVFRVKQKGI